MVSFVPGLFSIEEICCFCMNSIMVASRFSSDVWFCVFLDWDHFVMTDMAVHVHEPFAIDIGAFCFFGQTDRVDHFIFELNVCEFVMDQVCWVRTFHNHFQKRADQRACVDRRCCGHAESCDLVGSGICYQQSQSDYFPCLCLRFFCPWHLSIFYTSLCSRSPWETYFRALL